jgi:hypothetical protein
MKATLLTLLHIALIFALVGQAFCTISAHAAQDEEEGGSQDGAVFFGIIVAALTGVGVYSWRRGRKVCAYAWD